MKYQISPEYLLLKDYILSIPVRFESEGKLIYSGRNVLKIFTIGDHQFCVKSFKIPHLVNKIAYAYIRKSKAERSFLYAQRFLQLGIETPAPVAFIVFRNLLGVTRSYYIYKWEPCDCLFRGIPATYKSEELPEIYRQFVRFTYNFHLKGIYFNDYSGGNILISKSCENSWSFKLIDVNRTDFVKVLPALGLKNFSMLELPDDSLRIIATEYARLTGNDAEQMSKRLIQLTEEHNHKTQIKSKAKLLRQRIKSVF